MKCLLSVVMVAAVTCTERVEAQPFSSQGYSDRIEVGVHAGPSQVREDAVSSLPFKGFTIGGALRYTHTFGRNALALEGSVLNGQLHPEHVMNAGASLTSFRADLFYLRTVHSGSIVQIDIGPGLGLSMNNVSWQGLLNVSRTRELVGYFSLAGQVNVVLQEGEHGWDLTERLILPLVSVGKRTLQAAGVTEVLNGSEAGDMQWRALGGFFSVYNRISVRHALGARSSLGAEYTWNLSSFGGTVQFIRVDHNIGVTFTYQF